MNNLKNRIIAIIVAMTAITAIVSGCNSGNNAETTTTGITATPTIANTTSSETTTGGDNTSVTEITDATGDEGSGVIGLDGKEISSSMIAYDSAMGMYVAKGLSFARTSTGYYCDSTGNPELFDIPNYNYTGTTVDEETAEWKPVKVGDKFGSLEVTEAVMQFRKDPKLDEEFNPVEGEYVWTVFLNDITLSGTATMTGYIIQYAADEYGITTGDIHFYPDSAEIGKFPLTGMGFSLGASFFSPDGSFAAYEDSVGISLGNAMTDYSGNAEVDAAFAQKGKFIKAEVTFTNVISSYSEQMGTRHTSGTIESIVLK